MAVAGNADQPSPVSFLDVAKATGPGKVPSRRAPDQVGVGIAQNEAVLLAVHEQEVSWRDMIYESGRRHGCADGYRCTNIPIRRSGGDCSSPSIAVAKYRDSCRIYR
ncbi:MAG TPA: hypothetical protein VMV94_10990 [Phycisphaerae bacterium]|nr:hypothetical protein [Phycisphaerae bacterium]